MRQDTRIQVIAAIVLAFALAASGALVTAATAEAGRAQLGYADSAEESDPPEVAVGVALGAFRGMFTNILWMRAQKLKEQGKFYEAIELARTITRLQPRFPRVWGFHAWNMAYNISVATTTAEERWQWVDAGIRLLRDQGIPKNPNEMQIHRELAWIFIHKIQGINDDANHYYKRRLAREWTYLLGPPPPRAQTRAETVERFARKLEAIAASPDTEEDLIAKTPAAGEIIRRLRGEAQLGLDANLLRQTELRRAASMAQAEDQVAFTMAEEDRNEGFDAFLESLNGDERMLSAFVQTINFVRKRILTREHHMELARMIRYTRKYGPLDWRHPASHAIYWATRGVEEGLERVNTQDFDQVNTDRIITHAIQELFRWGEIYFDPVSDGYVQMLDLDFADTYHDILVSDLRPRAEARRKAQADARGEAEDPNRPYTLFGAGYEHFVRDLIRVYFRMGDRATAQKWLEHLQTTDLKNTNAPIHQLEELKLPLAEFVEADMKGRYTSPEVAASEVYAVLMDAFTRGLLQGNLATFQNNMQYANRVHEHYMEQQLIRTMADPNARRMEFMPRRFLDAASGAFLLVLRRGDIPVWRQSRMFRTLIGTGYADIGRAAYDQMVVDLKPSLPDFDQWFPEPPGMAEYRTKRRQLEAESDVERIKGVESQKQ